MSDAEEVTRRFVDAFAAADFDTMRRLLADDLTAYSPTPLAASIG